MATLAKPKHLQTQTQNHKSVLPPYHTSQPLRAKEVEVFFFTQIETFNQNLGQGSLSVSSNSRLVIQQATSKTPLLNQRMVMVPYQIGSHFLSKEKPIKSKTTKET